MAADPRSVTDPPARDVTGPAAAADGTLRERVLVVIVVAAMLTWPALWNQYPIVFADTGTYLSQAIHRYLGWDRPAFYSLFMLPLHWTRTTWPVIGVQALLTAWVLTLTWRALAPGRPTRWLLPIGFVLAVGTWLPWLVSELMPDVFTPLLVLVFALLALDRGTLRRWERWVLIPFAAFMIAAQLSSLPLWCAMMAMILACRAIATWTARPSEAAVAPSGGPPVARGSSRSRPVLVLLLPPVLALAALCSINLAGHGRFHPSPFGNVFLLARLIADGPAVDTLRAHCPDAGWRLCHVIDRLPDDSDIFLWSGDSPILAVGGHKAVSAEAGAIIAATLRDRPLPVLRAAVANTLRQLTMMRSGDGLEPWPAQVSPWIARDFPASELDRYASARQQAGTLSVPVWIGFLHQVLALAGIAAALILAIRLRRVAPDRSGFLLLAILVLPVSAAITGALSAPHDRYQARVAFLPALVAGFVAFGLARRC